MKTILTSLGVLVIGTSLNAQPTIELLEEHNGVNLTNVAVSPEGHFMTTGYGITSSCNTVSAITINTGEADWESISECGSVSWPDPYLTTSGLHYFDDNTAIALMSQGYSGYSDNPGIYKTVDGGESWDAKYEFSSDGGIDGFTDMVFMDENNGIAIKETHPDSYLSEVLKTTDGGESWELTGASFESVSIGMVTAIEDIYYAVGNRDLDWESLGWTLYKSLDFGTTWEEVHSEDSPLYSLASYGEGGIQFLTPEIGYIGLQDNETAYSYLKKTVDGGETWSHIDLPVDLLPEKMSLNDLYFLNPDVGFVVAGNHCDDVACYRGYAVLYTADGGESWEILAKAPYGSFALYNMAFDQNTGIGYVVGGDINTAQGRIFKITMPNVGIDSDMTIEHSIFPNPSVDGTINISVNGDEDMTLSVYGMDGKKVHTEKIFAGNKLISIQLESGVYVYELRSEDKHIDGKMTVL